MLRYYEGKNSVSRVEKGCIKLTRGTIREINKYTLQEDGDVSGDVPRQGLYILQEERCWELLPPEEELEMWLIKLQLAVFGQVCTCAWGGCVHGMLMSACTGCLWAGKAATCTCAYTCICIRMHAHTYVFGQEAIGAEHMCASVNVHGMHIYIYVHRRSSALSTRRPSVPPRPSPRCGLSRARTTWPHASHLTPHTSPLHTSPPPRLTTSHAHTSHAHLAIHRCAISRARTT